MIIFYNKQTGDIVGTIDGRVHDETHLNMWVGGREENDRLIVQWKSDGEDFYPDTPQADLFYKIDRREVSVKNFKVNTQNQLLEPLE